MERAEWLKKMRAQAEALYDHLAPAYWVTFGVQPNTTHHEFVGKLVGRLPPGSCILDAGCGAGRYDGLLLEGGNTVLGVDQAGSMLRRARDFFPEQGFPRLRYEKRGLQEMDFEGQFDGAACIEAMEHVAPEDWPGILASLRRALKPGGLLYLALDVADWEDVGRCYEHARAEGLPVVYGEVVDELEEAFAEVAAKGGADIPIERSDRAVYHFYPSDEQVRAWLEAAGLVLEEEGRGDGYRHLLLRRQ
jgi:SAM-dependent methyltransferase